MHLQLSILTMNPLAILLNRTPIKASRPFTFPTPQANVRFSICYCYPYTLNVKLIFIDISIAMWLLDADTLVFHIARMYFY